MWSWTRTAPTYTARASLVMTSDNRSPDQDAVLVQGFAAYLNSAAYQSELRADAVLPDGTSVEALTSAGSPILLIDVTGDDAALAQTAAKRVATVFSRDMNRGAEDRQEAMERLLQQLSAEIAQGEAGDASSRSQEALTALSKQLGELRAPRSNLLDVLQLEGGLTEARPSMTRSVGLSTVGGAVGGVLLALLLGRVSGRLSTRQDLEELGLTVLSDTVLDVRSPAFQPELRGVAAVLGARTDRVGALTVTSTSQDETASVLARGIAVEWALSGGTVLAVLPEPSSESEGSLSDDDPEVPRALQKIGGRITRGPVDSLWIMTPEHEGAGDDAGLLHVGIRALEAVRDERTAPIDSVIVAAPGLGVSPEADALSIVAGRVLVVVEPGAAQLHGTERALHHLLDNGVMVLGAVFVAAAKRVGRAKHKVAERRA